LIFSECPINASVRGLAEANFEKLSEFRYHMQCFERFFEEAAANDGITPCSRMDDPLTT
jgi:hypothetical protein